MLWVLCVLGSFRFDHGVASGDPLNDQIIIWTRITPNEDNAVSTAQVRWQVDTQVRHTLVMVASGVTNTSVDKDWTVKMDVTGLKHSTNYTYSFSVGNAVSPVGKFHLPPPISVSLLRLRFAIFSCSNWRWGQYHAYADAANRELDFWMHLGDYFYEYGNDDYPTQSEAVRQSNSPDHELLTLQDYRLRHALTRTDSSLQSLSASAPLIAVWDDHEIANNPWTDGAQNHNEGEGSWADRKLAAVQAYHEWLPTRAQGTKIYRSFQFGDLATLMMLETRLVNRTNPNEIRSLFPQVSAIIQDTDPLTWASSATGSQLTQLKQDMDTYRYRSNKTVLGDTQLAWLDNTIASSIRNSVKWQLVGQQIVLQDILMPKFANVPVPTDGYDLLSVVNGGDFVYFDTTYFRRALQGLRESSSILWRYGHTVIETARYLYTMGEYQIQDNMDSWSGYMHEREKFLDVLAQSPRAVVYSGDSHNAWAGVIPHRGNPINEFAGTSVTCPGLEIDWGFLPLDYVSKGFLESTQTLKFAGIGQRGYMLATITPEKHTMQYLNVKTYGDLKPAVAGNCFEISTKSEMMRIDCALVNSEQEVVPDKRSPGGKFNLTPVYVFVGLFGFVVLSLASRHHTLVTKVMQSHAEKHFAKKRTGASRLSDDYVL